jgi:hypothetical protein
MDMMRMRMRIGDRIWMMTMVMMVVMMMNDSDDERAEAEVCECGCQVGCARVPEKQEPHLECGEQISDPWPPMLCTAGVPPKNNFRIHGRHCSA